MDSLIATADLARMLGEPGLVVLDASLHLADSGRDARGEYRAAHIPGARFLDLAALVDPAAPIENTLPRADDVARRLADLGIGADSRVVIYDDSAIRSAARAWFVLRRAGLEHIAILDGGLGKWRSDGRALAAGEEPAPPPATPLPTPAGEVDRGGLRDKAALIANLASGAEQVLDARGAARFAGLAPEPRAGIAPGHIPGSRNLPYTALFAADGSYRDGDALRAAFAGAGIDPGRPLVVTCGSGVTACVLAFALDRLGKKDVALYDGSWAEWGADPATPKQTGA